MKRELVLTTTGADDTRSLAATIAGALRLGDIVSLTGELGAGKTCFVQGAAAALGVTDRVTSPTFLLRRDYEGRVPVVHLDVYRLDTLQEAAELGLDDVARCVTFIEWGDAMQPLLPADHLEIEFHAVLDDAVRDDPVRDGVARNTAAGDDGSASTSDRDGPAVTGAPGPAAGPGADAETDDVRRIIVRPRGADWRRRIVSLAVDCGPWRRDGGPTHLDTLEL